MQCCACGMHTVILGKTVESVKMETTAGAATLLEKWKKKGNFTERCNKAATWAKLTITQPGSWESRESLIFEDIIFFSLHMKPRAAFKTVFVIKIEPILVESI